MRRLNRWKNKWRKKAFIKMSVIFSVAYSFETTQIFAQAKTTDVSENEKSYFLAYLVVLFLIALGVVIVARSGRRAEKPKMVEKDLEYRLEKMSGRTKDT